MLEFAKRLGMLLLGRGTPSASDVSEKRRLHERPSLGSARRSLSSTMDVREDGIVGESVAWRYVMFRVDQVAETQATVLLLGETGTGKELVARAIHRRSTRRNNRFVALNCSALPATLIESELFGRERGAFTGANLSQAGRFELAHHGTLFLDEAGDLPLELQPKLLRVLQEGQVDRLGSTRTTNIDVRVIAATNRDLMNDVQNERFRRDLYYRSERLSDHAAGAPRTSRRHSPPGCAFPRAVLASAAEGGEIRFSKPVMRVLQEHHWPGNIRELENVIQRAIILSEDGVISLDDICLSNLTDRGSTFTSLRVRRRCSRWNATTSCGSWRPRPGASKVREARRGRSD